MKEDGEEIAEERKHLHFLFPNDVSNMHCPFFLSVTIEPPVLFAIVEIWRHCYCVISCMRTTQPEESLMKIWYSLSLSSIYLVSFSFLLFTFRSLFFISFLFFSFLFKHALWCGTTLNKSFFPIGFGYIYYYNEIRIYFLLFLICVS